MKLVFPTGLDIIEQQETLSSNTLFHFTNGVDYLEGIIKNGIIPRYSFEDLSMYKWYRDGQNTVPQIGIPMACLCDIPLSKVKYHLSWYGEYGIGIDKKWGMSRGICPILYTDHLSSTTLSVINALEAYKQLLYEEMLKEGDKQYLNLLNALESLMFLSKPYEGPFEHVGKKISVKNFYDEREWRFIPDLIAAKLKRIIFSSDEGMRLELKDASNSLLEKNALLEKEEDIPKLRLPVNPLNIKYIIVRGEEDVV